MEDARFVRFSWGMQRSRWVGCCGLCVLALACRTKAPESSRVSGPPPATAAVVQGEPSPAAPSDAVSSESPHGKTEPTSAPAGAPPPASSAVAGRLSTPSGLSRAPRVRVRVRVQTIVVESGNLEAEIIQRIIEQRAPELRDCYAPRLAQRRDLEGQLHFRLHLASDGEVSNAESVVGTLGDAQVVSCVRAVMQSLVLPGSGEPPAVIVVPLLFAPLEPPALD
ncbi:MAG: AgmX/PglI C-terminal domain-containing protein [Myxococcales bacterium]|nr:MAG: AgmX/PglI C-terminal domain-containing protein [Myxococcales bacterium]